MAEPEAGNWVILKAEGEGGLGVFRVRTDQPGDASDHPVNVSIRWAFAGDARGFPPPDTQESMDAFEEAIADLTCPPGPSYLVLVTTGFNLKEWEFYTSDYGAFMKQLNTLLRGHPRLPLEIEHTDDAAWELWHRVRDHASE